ncbi:MAG: hypothetical protein LBE78_12355, partial [Burkholderiaceae bacterium]|nr:hypothetical protein [Burkholderiaceae bacterium]
MNFLFDFFVRYSRTPIGQAVQALLAAGALGMFCMSTAHAADAQKSTRSLTPIEVIADVPASPLTFSADPKQPRQPLPA